MHSDIDIYELLCNTKDYIAFNVSLRFFLIDIFWKNSYLYSYCIIFVNAISWSFCIVVKNKLLRT